MAETKMIKIQYYRSKNSTPFKHRLVVKGLGFTRLNQIVERVDNEIYRIYARPARPIPGASVSVAVWVPAWARPRPAATRAKAAAPAPA